MKVFLSHSSADKGLARRLALDLQAEEIDVWLDEWELPVGEKFAQKIQQGLDEVEFVIVLLTRASVGSEWVNREWRSKVQHEAQTKRIAVVPVRGEPCEMPDFLAQRSHADISGGSYPLGFRHLLTLLRHYTGESSPMTIEGSMERSESSDVLPIVTPIALEVSKDLIPFFDPETDGRALNDLAPRMRDELRAEFGFQFPGVRIRGNETDMPPGTALILIDEVPEMRIDVRSCDGQVDVAEYLFSVLQGVLRRMAASFLDIDITRRLVEDGIAPASAPEAVPWFELTDVLRRLVDEEIGIGDLDSILEAVASGMAETSDTAMLAERARHALSHQITARFLRGRDTLPVALLSPGIEAAIGGAIKRTTAGAYLDSATLSTQDVLEAVRQAMDSVSDPAGVPILVNDVEVRLFLRRLVSLEFPSLHVVSGKDLLPDAPVEPIALIQLARRDPATPPGEGTPG